MLCLQINQLHSDMPIEQKFEMEEYSVPRFVQCLQHLPLLKCSATFASVS